MIAYGTMKKEKRRCVKSVKDYVDSITTPIFNKVLQEGSPSSMTTKGVYKSNGFRYLFRPNNYRRQVKVKEKDNSIIEEIRSAIVTTNWVEYEKLDTNKGEWNSLHKKARRIMERNLGRKLSIFEIVHHKDGNPRNNDIKNLIIMTPEEHTSIHHAGRRKGEKLKLPKMGDNVMKFNYNEHTKIISIKNYNPGITIQYGKNTLTAIYSCPLINGNKQVYLIQRDTIDDINVRIDEIKENIKKRLDTTIKEFSRKFSLSIPFKRVIWVRHENWIKGEEFIDNIPRDTIIHDTVFKKVYGKGIEFIGGKDKEPTATIKNYIKTRAIEDIAPEIANAITEVYTKFGSFITGMTPVLQQINNQNMEMIKLRRDITKIQRHRKPKKSLNKDIRKWI